MIFYIVITAIVCIFLYGIFYESETIGDMIGVCAMIGFASFLVMMMIGAGIFGSDALVEKSRKDVKIPIRSLKTSSEFQGRFFLGSGFIASGQVYYMYTVKDGFYKLWSSSATSARIKEIEKTESPYVHYQIVDYKFPGWFVPEWASLERTIYTADDIYIPKGSIIESFDPNVR